MLHVEDIHTYYGESHILQGVGLKVEAGESVALLGPNGMGKTTTLKTIMGLTPARKGSVRFQEQTITRWPPYKIARLGIGYVPEERGLFDELSVIENLRVPFLNLENTSNGHWQDTCDRIYELFPVLKARTGQRATSLSGGEQQMLATARALIIGRKMVILDEPTEGLAPLVIQDLVTTFKKIKELGITILLVEQNFETTRQVADRCYFLEKGRIRLEETMEVICERPDLLLKHLGVS